LNHVTVQFFFTGALLFSTTKNGYVEALHSIVRHQNGRK